MSVQMTCPFCKQEFPFNNGALDRDISVIGQKINQINREVAEINALPWPEKAKSADRKKRLSVERAKLCQRISELKTIRKATDQQIKYYEYQEFKTAVRERYGEREFMELVEIVQKRIEAYKISGLMRREYTRAAYKANVTSINKL